MIDLYGKKLLSANTRYILTRKKLPYKAIHTWGLFLRPMEANILLDISGNDIMLYDLEVQEPCERKYNGARILEYDLKGVNILNINNLIFCYLRSYALLKNKIRRILKICRGKK